MKPVGAVPRGDRLDEITISFFEAQPFAREIELRGGARLNRDVDADFAVAESGIAVFANYRVGRQAQQPHRFQRTAERRQHVAKIRTAVLQCGVGKSRKIGGVGRQFPRRSCQRSKRDTTPVSAVVPFAVMRNPFDGGDQFEIALQQHRIESKWKPKRVHVRRPVRLTFGHFRPCHDREDIPKVRNLRPTGASR